MSEEKKASDHESVQALVAVSASGQQAVVLAGRGALFAQKAADGIGAPANCPATPGLWHGEGLFGPHDTCRAWFGYRGVWKWRRPTVLDDWPMLHTAGSPEGKP